MRTEIITLVTLVCLNANAVKAHVVMSNPQILAGQRGETGLIITHGCNGLPTTSVSVSIPEGVTRVLPRALAGWNVRVEKRRLETPILLHGETVTEVTSKITWSGGQLEDALYQSFEFRYSAPDAPGQTLYFPTEQKCEVGGYSWSKVPALGQAWASLDTPAPFVKIATNSNPHSGH